MMPTKTFQTIFNTLVNVPQQVIRYISSAAMRNFSPSDDNYPTTGVQPFEGDPAEEKSV